jgi:hypothetical protein
MLRRFKQRAAEEFGPLAPRARPALITTEILQPAVSDHLKLNEEPDELAEEPHSSNCPEYRVAWYLLRDIAPHLIGIHSFADPELMECGSRCVIRQRTVEIRAVLNNFIDEQRREESLVAESPQEQSVVSEEPHTNLSGETDLLVSRFSRISSMSLQTLTSLVNFLNTQSVKVHLLVNNESFSSPTGDLRVKLPPSFMSNSGLRLSAQYNGSIIKVAVKLSDGLTELTPVETTWNNGDSAFTIDEDCASFDGDYDLGTEFYSENEECTDPVYSDSETEESDYEDKKVCVQTPLKFAHST